MEISRALVGALAIAAASAGPAIYGESARQTRPARAADFDVLEKSILELQSAMQGGTITSKELVAAYLARIQAYDRDGPRLSALIALNPRALEIADTLDQERRARGPRGPLHGIPVVIKDNYETADMPTTAGLLALAGMETDRDAFQVRRLREAGAVIIGKTNLHELASGLTTISSLGGQTKNPYDLTRNPGGSSGGTGAAIAANFAVAGMGSDTCGSIRNPASENNLFGLRGTLGLSSRDGIVPLSHTQDIGGPLARTVTDLAIMLDATVGRDANDPTTAASEGHIPQTYREALQADGLKNARIGIVGSLFGSAPEDGEVAAIVRKAIEAMRAQGAETIDVTIPGLDDLLRGSSLIDMEFKFDLMDYLARQPTAPVRSLGEILEGGRYHASLEAAYRRRNRAEARETDEYRRARVRRSAVREAVRVVMEEHRLRALAYPVLRRKPALIGEPQGGSNCQLSSSSGLPAISIPAGFTSDSLPIGVELLGESFGEAELLKLAYAYEQSAHPRRPPASAPALVNGKAPAPVSFQVTVTRDRSKSATDAVGAVTVSFTYDRLTGRVTYRIAATGLGADSLLAATLHEAEAGQRGPVIARLVDDTRSTTAGDLILSSGSRDALQQGRVYLAIVTTSRPAEALRVQLALP